MTLELREVDDLAGFAAVQELFEQIWRPDPHNPPVTTELMRALTKAGNYVVAAYQGGIMVGACVGFFGPPGSASMHSHIAGVATGLQTRGVGYALKQHQRAWALERGVRTISWTFDPLVSRNAYFNLVKLGATAAEYLPDFYGGMHDGINGDDETDRLLVRWDLTLPLAPAGSLDGAVVAGVSLARDASGGPVAGSFDGAVVALGRDDSGGPVTGSLDGETLLVAVPTDVAALRETDAGLARAWRCAVREVLAPRIAAGDRVTGFDRAGWYVLRKENR